MNTTTSHSSQSRTVLVLGGRGRFGLAAAQAFARAGWRVLAQMRPGAEAPQAGGVRWLGLSLENPQAVQALVDEVRQAGGASVVVHALNPKQYTRPAWEREAWPMLQTGMRVAQSLGATLMLPGNVYNFGAGMPEVLLEGAPQRPSMAMGQIRADMEARLEAATQRGELRAIIVRAGNFYGQGQGTWLDRAMLTGIQRGKLVFPGPMDVATTWAYLPDLAQTFVSLAQVRHSMAAFESLHFSGHSLTGADWVSALEPIARQQGWLRQGTALRVGGLPWPLVNVLGAFMPSWRALAMVRYLWLQPHRLDNRRLQALIGAEPHTPWPQALQNTLGDLGLTTVPAAASALSPQP